MSSLRWNQQPKRVANLLEKLGPIPERHNLKPVSVGMWRRDYEATMKGKIREKFANPYMLCAQSCMSTVLSNLVGADEVLFIFDRQHVHKAAMNSLRDVVFQLVGVDSRVKDVHFIPSKTTVCIDPADYLAYMVREHAMDADSARFKMGKSILGTKGGHGGIFNRQQLEEMAASFLKDGMGIGDSTRYSPDSFREIVKNPYWRGTSK